MSLIIIEGSIPYGQTGAGDAPPTAAAAAVPVIHHHAPGVMPRGGVHSRYVRDARTRSRPLGILLDVVDDASVERHAARGVEVGDGARGRRRRAPPPAAVDAASVASVAPPVRAVPHRTARIVQPVAILHPDVGAVVVEGEAGGRRASEGDPAHQHVPRVRPEGQVRPRHVDRAHVALDRDVLGVHEYGPPVAAPAARGVPPPPPTPSMRRRVTAAAARPRPRP